MRSIDLVHFLLLHLSPPIQGPSVSGIVRQSSACGRSYQIGDMQVVVKYFHSASASSRRMTQPLGMVPPRPCVSRSSPCFCRLRHEPVRRRKGAGDSGDRTAPTVLSSRLGTGTGPYQVFYRRRPGDLAVGLQEDRRRHVMPVCCTGTSRKDSKGTASLTFQEKQPICAPGDRCRKRESATNGLKQSTEVLGVHQRNGERSSNACALRKDRPGF